MLILSDDRARAEQQQVLECAHHHKPVSDRLRLCYYDRGVPSPLCYAIVIVRARRLTFLYCASSASFHLQRSTSLRLTKGLHRYIQYLLKVASIFS